jgi:hypothetical protein
MLRFVFFAMPVMRGRPNLPSGIVAQRDRDMSRLHHRHEALWGEHTH